MESRSAEGITDSSQSIVDELFKDFISKKISKSSKSVSSKDVGGKSGKVDEISKLLDMEISSIQAQTKDTVPAVNEMTVPRSTVDSLQHSHPILPPSFPAQSIPSTSEPVEKETACIPLPLPSSSSTEGDSIKCDLHPDAWTKVVVSSTSSSLISPSAVSTSISTLNSNSTSFVTSSSTTRAVGPLGKKMMIPKQLGCMLSTESLSLIQSKERIDKNQRVWEDGEVPSSHSGESAKEDSDSDNEGCPSETGSINSDQETWTSQSSSSRHKKKHKHKHKKKKKKKSSRERDRVKGGEEKDQDRRKDKEREKENAKDVDIDKPTLASDGKIEDPVTTNGNLEKEKKKDDCDTGDKDIEKIKDSDSESSKQDEKSSSRYKSDSRKRDKEKKRKREKSRSRTPKRSKRSRSRSRSPRKSRKSESPRRGGFSEWDARSYSDAKKLPKDPSSRSRSRSRSHSRKSKRSAERKRERSKERLKEKSKEGVNDLRVQIDKAKLRKIAIANTLNCIKSGQPGPVQVDLATVKSGGKSVEELTDFCKRISEKEQEKLDNAVSDSSDDDIGMPQSEEEEPLIHHPFKVKETASNIVMNIRNAKQLPVLTPSEKQAQQATLRLAFPVSSGSHHRATESDWVPVERTTAPPTSSTSSRPASTQVSQPSPSTTVFPETQKVDIGAIISERLQAVRKLQQNPYDVQALSSMHKAQEKASQWVQSKYLPGQFTGSTGAQVLSQQEIMGDKRHQAWAKKSQFVSAAPVTGGIGMFLLQKMGWKKGEGLGKNHEGKVEPLQLNIKIDRKGLTTAADNPRARPQVSHFPKAKDLSHKHPVSALMELCNKRRWGPPGFTIVSEDGPDHKKYFLFKVKVNNVEYQPAVPSSNKKSAKAQCAAVCLQELGLLPRDAALNY